MRAIEASIVPSKAKVELPSLIRNITPIKFSTPDKSSTTVTVNNRTGTEFLNGELEKWELNHSKFPFLSTTLSIPDCKNKIVKNNTDKIWTIKNTDSDEFIINDIFK